MKHGEANAAEHSTNECFTAITKSHSYSNNVDIFSYMIDIKLVRLGRLRVRQLQGYKLNKEPQSLYRVVFKVVSNIRIH